MWKLDSTFPHKSLWVRLQVASQPVSKRASDQGVLLLQSYRETWFCPKETNNNPSWKYEYIKEDTNPYDKGYERYIHHQNRLLR